MRSGTPLFVGKFLFHTTHAIWWLSRDENFFLKIILHPLIDLCFHYTRRVHIHMVHCRWEEANIHSVAAFFTC